MEAGGVGRQLVEYLFGRNFAKYWTGEGVVNETSEKIDVEEVRTVLGSYEGDDYCCGDRLSENLYRCSLTEQTQGGTRTYMRCSYDFLPSGPLVYIKLGASVISGLGTGLIAGGTVAGFALLKIAPDLISCMLGIVDKQPVLEPLVAACLNVGAFLGSIFTGVVVGKKSGELVISAMDPRLIYDVDCSDHRKCNSG
jgi:hypothetical protein